MQLTSFYTALTGLNNNSMAINTIGDNLANMNTTAFKVQQSHLCRIACRCFGHQLHRESDLVWARQHFERNQPQLLPGHHQLYGQLDRRCY